MDLNNNNICTNGTNDEEPEDIKVYIRNVVCCFTSSCHINLRRLALNGYNVEYKQKTVCLKLRKPAMSAIIHASGSIWCTGAKSVEDARIGARRICRLLQKLDFPVKLSNYRVTNVVSTCNVQFKVNMAKLEKLSKEICYCPEINAGANFRVEHFKTTLTIYTSGSIIIRSPSVENTTKSISYVYPFLYQAKFNKPFANLTNLL
ncbi:unnamed protein product [Brachionus calyciflorus]|uniref:TATA box-binding protein-like 1 n=1 Tax=Brachionus calyciflorus TaxID=104777 RepID=A0A813VEX1_9BILA|nr:unnamed protein product [Brachionus calyciflorus]